MIVIKEFHQCSLTIYFVTIIPKDKNGRICVGPSLLINMNTSRDMKGQCCNFSAENVVFGVLTMYTHVSTGRRERVSVLYEQLQRAQPQRDAMGQWGRHPAPTPPITLEPLAARAPRLGIATHGIATPCFIKISRVLQISVQLMLLLFGQDTLTELYGVKHECLFTYFIMPLYDNLV